MLAMIQTALADTLQGVVVRPGDTGWDCARPSFNLLVDQQPAAVAFPVDETDASTFFDAGIWPGCAP